jgi:hypothetical protein
MPLRGLLNGALTVRRHISRGNQPVGVVGPGMRTDHRGPVVEYHLAAPEEKDLVDFDRELAERDREHASSPRNPRRAT